MLSKKSDPRAMLPKRSVNVPAICSNRFDGNASSVQMNTAPLPSPPDSSANCTVSASWIHSWDLPLPASPHISVMPRVAMPLRVIASSAEQPNVMYIHCSRISVMHWVAATSFEVEIEVSSIDHSFYLTSREEREHSPPLILPCESHCRWVPFAWEPW